jgi:phosphonatase-like hydrolase
MALRQITVACLDMAGTTVSDEGGVLAAFRAAVAEFGLVPGAAGYDEAMTVVQDTMGQSKIDVFRRLLDDDRAQQANLVFEASYAESIQSGLVTALPGALETITALRAAGIKVCLCTGFAPVTRDALLDALGWGPLIDLALSPADAGRGRPWPDIPLTALLRLRGGAVSELAVVGDTAADVESGLRAGAGLVVGVTTGSVGREALAAAGAPHILDSVTGLLQLAGVGAGAPGQP